MIAFLESIGIGVRYGAVADGFVPGLRIEGGAIMIDTERWLYAGDLLHEAGHLAVQEPARRGTPGGDGGGEMAAIAWSFAAALHLGIHAAVVFHADGYKGGGGALLENFLAGRYVGVPMLEWLGLCDRGAYPSLRCWTRPPSANSSAVPMSGRTAQIANTGP